MNFVPEPPTGRPAERDEDALFFVPLGGAGEIGMNLNLYAHRGQWLILDCGVTFGDDSEPGVDVVMPDPAFIVERRDRLLGIVATHAHEDHIGAIPYLWRQLRCPVWATPFTASLLRAKLAEAGLADQLRINVVPLSARFAIGPFDLELVTLTHSIPEPNAVVIRTSAGTVLHTGDWKLDPDPLIGPTADEAALRRIGDEGVLAMIGDSTNALRPGVAGSEADLRPSLTELIGRYDGRVAVACFASNVARLSTVAHAAAANDRQVALIGRSLWRIYKAARENGYLTDLPPFLTEDDVGYIPRDKILLICTGSQGEPRAALARIAREDHPNVVLEEGDAVIFSSRIIPGNEKSIGRLQNALARLGVEIVTEEDHFVHVSGHPAREELSRMYQMVRPRVAIPVHGEARHLRAHAELAQECQVNQALLVENGDMVRLAGGAAEIVDQVPVGRLASDGKSLLPFGGNALRERRRVGLNGSAVATLVRGRHGRLMAPAQIALIGLVEPEAAAAAGAMLRDAAERAYESLPEGQRRDDEALRDAVRRTLRRAINERFGKRPLIEVQIVTV
ncbi:MAG: ribonuclease J [Alphaproteobacteria bacterium]|nr:ribonuclease J [Alphaproteobacteria bacterium]